MLYLRNVYATRTYAVAICLLRIYVHELPYTEPMQNYVLVEDSEKKNVCLGLNDREQ